MTAPPTNRPEQETHLQDTLCLICPAELYEHVAYWHADHACIHHYTCTHTDHRLHYKYALVVTRDEDFQYRIALHSLRQAFKPIIIDFTQGRIAHRLQYGGGRRQALGRAMGLHKGKRPNVLDVTAGLGQDAMVLAHLGCRITMVERHPVLFILLSDGLRRLQRIDHIRSNTHSYINVIYADAIDYISSITTSHFDAIYADPMYPMRDKSSLVKKEMRVIRDIAGDDTDSALLIRCAIDTQVKRVIVKRPLHATAILPIQPHHVISTKSTRYDVYVNCA